VRSSALAVLRLIVISNFVGVCTGRLAGFSPRRMRSELVVKVKEPLAAERKKLRQGRVLFAYLHLAPDREQTEDLMKAGVTAIAYETVTGPQGTLPLLTPMSEVAGRMAPHVGAHCLQKENGGRGVLLAGVPGVSPANVVILGGGVAGTNAALIACGMGADVAVLDRNPEALRRIAAQFGNRVRTLFSTRDVVERLCRRADLVIATALVPGSTAPKLISAQTVKAMKPGAVIVDVAIDQGGCAETSRPTTHSHPTYVVDDVVHYCVTNMPGAVARTSTFALSNVTTSFVLALADKGWRRALNEDPHLRDGLNSSFCLRRAGTGARSGSRMISIASCRPSVRAGVAFVGFSSACAAWVTLPTIACPPSLTDMCRTVTFCSPPVR
jgi:alanine dehydrogenase